jgi:hypothetical protein
VTRDAQRPASRQIVRLVLSLLGLLVIAAVAVTSCVDRSRLSEQTPLLQAELEHVLPVPGAAVLNAETRPGVDGVTIEAAYVVARPPADLAAHYDAQLTANGWRAQTRSALDSAAAAPMIYCKTPYQLAVRWLEYNSGDSSVYLVAIGYGSVAVGCQAR